MVRCVICEYAHADILLLPCQHLCLCARCGEESVECHLCGKKVAQKLRVYFSCGFDEPETPPPPEVPEEDDAVFDVPAKVLAITNGEEFHEAHMQEVEKLLSEAVPLNRITSSQALKLLGVKVPVGTSNKLLNGDRHGYSNDVINAAQSAWRMLALRYHPDKVCSELWWQQDGRLAKLTDCFKFLQNVVELVEKRYAKFLIPIPKRVALDYFVTRDHQLCATLRWTAVADLDTIVTFEDEIGLPVESIIPPGIDSCSFYEDEQPHVFDDANFPGFTLAHIMIFGKYVGTSGHSTTAKESVPSSARTTKAELQRAEQLKRLDRLKQQLNDLARKVEPVQICFAHDVFKNKRCRAWSCTRLHLNTASREDRAWFMRAKRSFFENIGGHANRRKF